MRGVAVMVVVVGLGVRDADHDDATPRRPS